MLLPGVFRMLNALLRKWFFRLNWDRIASETPRRRRLDLRLEMLEGRLTPTAPTVLSINKVSTAPFTNATGVDFAVTFSQAVTGVDAADFRTVTTGALSTST